MEFKGLYISFMLIGLCAISMIAFALTLQSSNNINTLANDSRISGLNNNLTLALGGTKQTADSAYNSTYSSPPNVDTGGLMLTSIPGTAITLYRTINVIFGVLTLGLGSIFGVSPLVMTILGAILVGGIILLIWSLIRLGR